MLQQSSVLNGYTDWHKTASQGYIQVIAIRRAAHFFIIMLCRCMKFKKKEEKRNTRNEEIPRALSP